MQLILAVVVVFISSVAAAAETGSSVSPAASGSESLGNHLLNDLTPSAPQTSAAPQPDPRPGSESTDGSRRAAPRYDDLGDDISQQSGPLSLVRVRQDMQRAESLLGEPIASHTAGPLNQATGVQRHIVHQLDQLIAELSKQCQGGQCPPGDPPPGANEKSQAKPGNSQDAAAQGQTAARDSTARLSSAGGKPADKGDIEDVASQLWGHLPQRTREQMMQSFSDEFLPKYEKEIAEYYRRLSEEKTSSRATP